ncbi:MAG: hypothetical protein D4S02_06825 [Rhodocyclaceae bacterium]|nr:MAG: hypothetical protein D4S02_06825 [Rhodocyclaceae bacterium]
MKLPTLLHAASKLIQVIGPVFGVAAGAFATPFFQTYVIVGANGEAVARAVTSKDQCPKIRIDASPPVSMSLRSTAAKVPNRGGGQKDNKDADFPVSVCEAVLPAGAKKIAVDGIRLPAPVDDLKRILFIGDTGCRMKASEDAFQACNNRLHWPFKTISQRAAAWHPDLVVHLGDIHYRESPCPVLNRGCAGSPWGYGFDAWRSDLFLPARALLKAAPWVVVRGNHESCWRAGQGWFRFMDARPYVGGRSCDDPARDQEGDFSAPYAVPLAGDTQLIVFDSSRAAGKRYASGDEAYELYADQLRQVEELSRGKAQNFFLSHHPVLGFASSKHQEMLPGNVALQSVMSNLHPERLFAPGINLTLHGHVHLFEAISFKSDHPAVFVSGNAGSALSLPLQASGPISDQPAPGAIVEEFFSSGEFGFLTLERVNQSWKFTEWDRGGKARLRCSLNGAKLNCLPAKRDIAK